MFSKVHAPLAALVLLLGACQQPSKVHPALWQVDGPGGQKAWLFGTIHALPDPVDWHSRPVDAALAGADRIVLEVAEIEDESGIARTFAQLGGASATSPLRTRVPPAALADYDRYLKRHGIDDAPLARQETWAAALILAQYSRRDSGSESANGVDRAVKQAAGRRPVEEFEGADAQLRIFDALPEHEQRDLLAAVVAGNGDAAAESRAMERAWAKGDLAAITADTQGGLLSDPELRQALLVGRNRTWLNRLTTMLARRERPFVAVGTAHLVGPDGLPAQLTARGYKVTRLQ